MFHEDLSWLSVAWCLHGLFCLALFIGVILFVVWASKHLNKKGLKKLVIWLLAIGLVGLLITAPFANRHFKDTMGKWGKFKMMDEVTEEVTE